MRDVIKLLVSTTALMPCLAWPAFSQVAAAPDAAEPTTATAQAATPPAAPEAAADDTVGDIVVFAQRRAAGESAQKVPIAITAVDSRILKSTNSVSLIDVGSLAPNVQTNTTGTFPGFPNFAVRGIGLSSSIRSVDPAVNIVQDGMVLAYQAGAVVSTFDLESVEILRGPQGVLFGRNATGGAFVLRTRRPGREPAAQFDVSYGNFNAVDFNASVEGPLGSDSVLGKIAVLFRRNSGTILNTNDGIFAAAPGNPTGTPSNHRVGRIGDIRDIVIKPTFFFDISGGTRLTLFTQYQDFDDDGTVPRNFATPAGGVATQSATQFGYTPTTTGYTTNIGDVGNVRIRGGHVIAELENDIGAGLLTTIGAFRRIRYDSTTNNAGTPFDGLILPNNREGNTEYSLESRYNVGLSDALDLTAGLFYLGYDTKVTEQRRTIPATNPPTFAYVRGDFDQHVSSYAAFANLDWTVVPGLKLSLGGRFTSDHKRLEYTPLVPCTDATFQSCVVPSIGATPATSVPAPARAKTHWNDFAPRAVLTWQAAERVLLFASFTQGFRSGNYNPRTTDRTGVGIGPANPETVDAYELGVKSDLFDRRVRLNVSLFQSEYRDIQQVVTIPGAVIVQSLVNAANSRIRGLEGELTVKPVRALELNANLGYIDAKYKEFTVPIVGVTDPSSLRFVKVPKWTGYAAATYTHALPGAGASAALRVSYEYRSSYATDFLNTPGLDQKGFGLTNADLSFNQPTWSVSLFGRNLFDVVYADTKARNFAYVAYGGAPRTYGVRLTAKL